MRKLLLVVLLTPLAAFADSITVGTVTFLGYNAQGFSEFQMSFIPTAGITAQPLSFWAGITANGGLAAIHFVTTDEPVSFFQLGGPATGFQPCPCKSVGVLLFFNNPFNEPFTFLLANGEPFKAYHQYILNMLPPPGQDFIQIGQSSRLTLTSVPEPATVVCCAIGLTLIGLRKRTSRGRLHWPTF